MPKIKSNQNHLFWQGGKIKSNRISVIKKSDLNRFNPNHDLILPTTGPYVFCRSAVIVESGPVRFFKIHEDL